MIQAVLNALRCPVCASSLSSVTEQRSGSGSLRCARGHSFDLAKQGYANLLGGRGPAGAETAQMVATRAALLDAGHLHPVTAAVVETAGTTAGADGLIVDVGAGTGHHVAAVLDALPRHRGLALDVSKAAARRAARAHPRLAAVVADAWRRLPLADGCADVVLDLFAPRNGAEFRRVLRDDGSLLVVTPAAGHLVELVAPLGLLRVDPDKSGRLERGLGQWFEAVGTRGCSYRLDLSREECARFVAMGPSAWHTDPSAVAAVLAGWPEPISVTVSVTLQTYRRRG